jgi:multiple sugar transport system permease protein
MLLPSVAFLTAVFLGPFVYMIWLSLTDLSFAEATHSGNWIGLSNYAEALRSDPLFVGSVTRSSVFTLLCVLPQMVIGIIGAELLHSRVSAQRLLSPLLALPVLLPTVVVGLYWRLLLQGEFGVVSYYVSKLGIPWAKGILSDSHSVLPVLAAIDTWQWAPFVVLVLLAARNALPRTVIEAAWVDGASAIRTFFDVTLPSLLPIVFIVALIRSIDSFKEFDKVFVLTGGGPGNASELASIYIWRTAFRQWEFGYAAALCVLVYILIYVASHIGIKKAALPGVQ